MGVTMVEIAWLAGLLEGEGYFSFSRGTLSIRLQMTDKDVIEHAALLLRGPEYVPREYRIASGRMSWYVNASGTRAAQWMMTLYPLMGVRRRERIAVSLLEWRSRPGLGKYNSWKTHCKRGHEFTPENTRIYKGKNGWQGRQCRICDALRTRKSASKRGIRKKPFTEDF